MNAPPIPAPAPEPGELPHALTFFLTDRARRAVLRVLARIDADRATALCRALGIGAAPPVTPPAR